MAEEDEEGFFAGGFDGSVDREAMPVSRGLRNATNQRGPPLLSEQGVIVVGFGRFVADLDEDVSVTAGKEPGRGQMGGLQDGRLVA